MVKALKILLVAAIIIVVIFVLYPLLFPVGVIAPAAYPLSRCSGFQYFTYQEQSLSADNGYTIRVKNGAQEVMIKGLSFDGKDGTELRVAVDGVDKTSQLIEPDKSITIYVNDVTELKSGDLFAINEVFIYFVRGEYPNSSDRGICSGMVTC